MSSNSEDDSSASSLAPDDRSTSESSRSSSMSPTSSPDLDYIRFMEGTPHPESSDDNQTDEEPSEDEEEDDDDASSEGSMEEPSPPLPAVDAQSQQLQLPVHVKAQTPGSSGAPAMNRTPSKAAKDTSKPADVTMEDQPGPKPSENPWDDCPISPSQLHFMFADEERGRAGESDDLRLVYADAFALLDALDAGLRADQSLGGVLAGGQDRRG